VTVDYLELSHRIRGELADLEVSIEKVKRSWDSAKKAGRDRDAYLDSVALNLHAFYSGLERLFELISRHVDGSSPQGLAWHRDLLHQMADEMAGVRPAVISEGTARELDHYRRFRHLVRNVYTVSLEAEKMSGLVESLAGIWPKLFDEMDAFAMFLEALA
jgi:hypothetical protein